MDLTEKVPVVKDGRCYLCTLLLQSVKGGARVLYVTEDGMLLKEEPLFRYKERLKRRKTGSKGYAIKV